MSKSLSRLAAVTLLAAALGALAQGTAHAQGLYPRNYALSCTGNACTTSACTSSGPVSLTGRVQLSSSIAGTGSIAINANFGSIIQPSSLNPMTVRIINGTASEKSVGGNAIPIGCFVAVFSAPGAPFLTNTFGCYSDTEHDFDLTSQVKSAGTFSCHGKEM